MKLLTDCQEFFVLFVVVRVWLWVLMEALPHPLGHQNAIIPDTPKFHNLRGSWATRMNENGVDAYTIMKIGGWSSLSVLERYLRRNQKNFILAVNRWILLQKIVKRAFSKQSWH